MSLPKRDGVHDRYYLIHKPDTAPEVLAEADACIQDILDGTARENHAAYPTVVRNQSGTPFLPSQLLERYLSKLPLKGFPYHLHSRTRSVGASRRPFPVAASEGAVSGGGTAVSTQCSLGGNPPHLC